MSSEWLRGTLGEYIELSNGKTRPEEGGRTSVYGSNGIIGSCQESNSPKETIVIGRVGTYCGSLHFSKEECWVTDNAIKAVAKKGGHSRYFFDLLKTCDLGRLRAGSGQPLLNQSILGSIEIDIPPIEEQKAIAHILGTLDDKIELNRKTNETLEAMAKALFKSWFVDFDPVRAKAEGRLTGLPAEISNLFPDSFEDSELGEIPSGWRVDSIYSVASVTYGAPFSSSLFNGEGNGTPVARIRDLPGESPGVFTTEVHPKGILIAPGDIVVGMDGEFRAYLWGGEECWMNQRVCKFIPGIKGRTCFLRESIRKPLMDVEMSETATTVIHLGKGDIDGFKVVVPVQEILDTFSAATTPLYEEVVANKQQTRVLANIRDALLPKLISGEIRIPDAEKMLEEVGV